jgi:hypothetical protein
MGGFDVSEIVPRGFVVEGATRDGDGFVIAIRGAATPYSRHWKARTFERD